VPAVRAATAAEGLNVFVADGEAAGQEVPHVHVHLIPRHRGDGFGLRFPPGYGSMPEREELEAVAALVRSALT
jgi:histidine triad (HIT) family protein